MPRAFSQFASFCGWSLKAAFSVSAVLLSCRSGQLGVWATESALSPEQIKGNASGLPRSDRFPDLPLHQYLYLLHLLPLRHCGGDGSAGTGDGNTCCQKSNSGNACLADALEAASPIFYGLKQLSWRAREFHTPLYAGTVNPLVSFF